jgi:transcription elongation factor GreB
MKKLDEQQNYITVQGYELLKTELNQLKTRDRPKVVNTVSWAAGNGDRSENGDYIYGKKKLREIDRRIIFLSDRIKNSIVIDPGSISFSGIYFGASVKIIDANDIQRTYKIVGVDEVDVAQGRISWRSPLGSALLYKSPGDYITYSTPQGVREIEIIEVWYE